MHLILCRISMDICIFPTRKDKILSLEDILKSSIDMPCLNLRARRGTDNINIKTKQTNNWKTFGPYTVPQSSTMFTVFWGICIINSKVSIIFEVNPDVIIASKPKHYLCLHVKA